MRSRLWILGKEVFWGRQGENVSPGPRVSLFFSLETGGKKNPPLRGGRGGRRGKRGGCIPPLPPVSLLTREGQGKRA